MYPNKYDAEYRPLHVPLHDNHVTRFLKDPEIRPYFNDLNFDENNVIYPGPFWKEHKPIMNPPLGENQISWFFEKKMYDPTRWVDMRNYDGMSKYNRFSSVGRSVMQGAPFSSMSMDKRENDWPLFEIPPALERDFLNTLAEKPSDVKVFKNLESKNWYAHLKEMDQRW